MLFIKTYNYLDCNKYNHLSRSNNYSVLTQYRRENNTADTEQKTRVFLQTYQISFRKLHHGRHRRTAPPGEILQPDDNLNFSCDQNAPSEPAVWQNTL
jgi:hypothetical protein